MGDERLEAFECVACNVTVHGSAQWDQHQSTRNHIRKEETAKAFDLSERDMFVDVTSEAFQVVAEAKSTFHGAEYVVFDRSSADNKCILCKSHLKDGPTIVAHLKSQKHIHVYFKSHFPVVFEDVQRKARNRNELQALVLKYADVLCRKYGGRKEPRVYQRGYYDSLSEERKREVDRILAEKMIEMEAQWKHQLKDANSPHSSRSRSRDREDRSRDRKSSRERSRERDRRRDERDRHFERPPTHSSSQHHGGDSRQRIGSPERVQRHWAERSEPPSSFGQSRHVPPSGPRFPPPPPPHGHGPLHTRSEPRRSSEEEALALLSAATAVAMDSGERAYIQDLIDAIDGPVIGLEHVAEYADKAGRFEPGYFCSLCQTRLDPPKAVQHSVSDAHSMAYLKAHRNKQYMALCIGTLGEEVRRQMKARYLDEIARDGGITTRRIAKKLDFGLKEPGVIFAAHRRVIDHFPPAPSREGGGRRAENWREPQPSAKERQAKELAELERSLPAFGQRNLEEGWYSIRSKSTEYFRRLALHRDPDALVYSIRDTDARQNFYGDWNPQLMRRLQDKFNFSLDHIQWLQKLLAQWQVPTFAKLQLADLRPLESEVESSVLSELVDQILKPVNTLRYMQVFEYEKYDKPEPRQVVETLPPPQMSAPQAPSKRDHGSRHLSYRGEVEMERETPSPKAGGPVSIKLSAKPPKKLLHNPDVAAKLGADGGNSSGEESGPERQLSEVEGKLYNIIDSVIAIAAEESSVGNPILRLLGEFRHARDILFTLATRQPTQLQQLVTVTRNPSLVVPVAVLDQLRRKLREIEEETERERAARRKRRQKDRRGGPGKKRREEEQLPTATRDPSVPFYMQQSGPAAPAPQAPNPQWASAAQLAPWGAQAPQLQQQPPPPQQQPYGQFNQHQMLMQHQQQQQQFQQQQQQQQFQQMQQQQFQQQQQQPPPMQQQYFQQTPQQPYPPSSYHGRF